MERGRRKLISEIKKFYDELVETNDLENVYPKSLGNWSQDKQDFIKYFIETIELQQEIELDSLKTLEASHLRNFKDELGLTED